MADHVKSLDRVRVNSHYCSVFGHTATRVIMEVDQVDQIKFPLCKSLLVVLSQILLLHLCSFYWTDWKAYVISLYFLAFLHAFFQDEHNICFFTFSVPNSEEKKIRDCLILLHAVFKASPSLGSKLHIFPVFICWCTDRSLCYSSHIPPHIPLQVQLGFRFANSVPLYPSMCSYIPFYIPFMVG